MNLYIARGVSAACRIIAFIPSQRSSASPRNACLREASPSCDELAVRAIATVLPGFHRLRRNAQDVSERHLGHSCLAADVLDFRSVELQRGSYFDDIATRADFALLKLDGLCEAFCDAIELLLILVPSLSAAIPPTARSSP